MKKILIVVSLAMSASVAGADILLTEDFAFTGAATANGWTAYSGADASITSDGSALSVGSGSEDIRTSFTALGTDKTYASFVLNMDKVPTSTVAAYTFGFSTGATMSTRFGFVADSSGLFNLAIFGGGTTSQDATTVGYSAATDYLITIGYDESSLTHSLWVNSDGSNEASPDLSYVGGTAAGLNSFYFRQAAPYQRGDAAYTVSDLVVASTFAEAVPTAIPEPATMSLIGLGALAMVLRRKMAK